MNIEESIKILDKFTTEHKLFNIKHSDGLEEALETLLTAYEKEKETTDKLKKINIPVDTLIAEFERLEDLEDDLTTVYLNGVYDGEKKVKDKIKAKIEEARKKYNDIHTKRLRDCGIAEERELAKIEFGQSLLEKE